MLSNELRLLAADLDEGENRYMECPSCGAPNKFSMRLEDGRVVYHCFRASCTLHAGGGFNVHGGIRVVRTTQNERKQRFTPFTGELEPLSQEWREYLSRKIGFTDWHFDTSRVMFAPEQHRVAFPILDPLGRRKGWLLRSYERHATTKALTRMDSAEPHLAWYMTHTGQRVCLVVEDSPSAIRASRYINSVALLGTGCSPDYAKEISAHCREVVWALDADATGQALKLHRKYSILFEHSRVLVLPKDIKDMTEDELCELLSSETFTAA